MHPVDTKMCQYSLCSSDSACLQTSLKTYVLHMKSDWVSHDTWSAQGKMCFQRIFFAANAVRLVSFLFTLYSNRMYNAQGCVYRCKRVETLKQAELILLVACGIFRGCDFKECAIILEIGLFLCSRSKQHFGQQQ